METNRAVTASKEADQTTTLDKTTNLGWHLLSIEKWLQLVRPSERLATLLNGILAFLAVAHGWGTRPNYGNPTCQSTATGQKKPKWTRLLIIDSQAVKNTCNASVESKGFCHYKCTNGIKRHLAVDTLGLPFFTHCTKANISDDQGLIELLSHNLDYFRVKESEHPKDYHPTRPWISPR